MGLSFELQMHYENEGGVAGLAGKTRADCPYDREKQPGPWNHWVFGNDVARSEVETIKRGIIEWYSTSSTAPVCVSRVEDSIADGTWKPRFATLPLAGVPVTTTLPRSE